MVLRELKWPVEPVGDCGLTAAVYRRLPHLCASRPTQRNGCIGIAILSTIRDVVGPRSVRQG
jgi:hypothetical protein